MSSSKNDITAELLDNYIDAIPLPIRCFTCNKVISILYKRYLKLIEEGMEANKALDLLEIRRYCCRRMIISSI